ncbi:MAG TPA: D-alanine--D-alanine ligase [Candidatus Limnocylindrales bacterium]|nr:D-alanine--D-alanine ligase [Candidatus Limnocylindrales bacterium]
MNKKLRVAILFGGKSAEHEISLISARNIVEAMDKRKYEIVSIGIDKQGRWHLDEGARLLHGDTESKVEFPDAKNAAAVLPGDTTTPMVRSTGAGFGGFGSLGSIDVVFPILHGPFGEDGTVQGLLKLANVPFVGAGVLGSAVGMDKDMMKRLLRDAKLPIGKFLAFNRSDKIGFANVKKTLGMPLFVKPANLGSSVGISKVVKPGQFAAAVKEAFRYDNKIVIEECIEGREIECSVLGNDQPIASLPGEIVVNRDFYSYDAKYIDDQGARLEIPAKLPKAVIKQVRALALRVYKTLGCEGMGRVDFFVQANGRVLVNEINTIPGFTRISMYPKMWEASGISYSSLIDRLIQLAIQRHRAEKRLRTSK